jgi:hypothetical protein
MWNSFLFRTIVLHRSNNEIKLTYHSPESRLHKLKHKCENTLQRSEYKSTMYKWISLTFNLTIILIGALTTLFSSLNYLSQCTSNYNKTLICFGVLVSIIKSVQMIFNFERKSVEFKKTSVKIRKLLREIDNVDTTIEVVILTPTLNKIEEQLDEYEFNIFLDGLDDK